MSFIPDNFINQLSDLEGNISHQGILASNISKSTLLTSTFPTTPTGDSLGHYHYTESGTNALKFLNACGSGLGGHKFYTANSTTAPVNTASIGLDGFTIDRSTGGSPVLVNLPNITISTPVAVVFASPINQPPWNIVGLGNPIQVLQNTVNMVTGVTYYLTAFSTQLGQVTTNPDGTGIIDCTDLVSLPQPILAWENGQFTPSTIQTINLFENMTITTDLNNSVLNASSLTFNNVNVKMNQVQPTLIYSSPVIYADGHQPANSNSIKNTYGYSGWYYKNSAPNVAPTNKINWYFPPKNATNTSVSDLKGISISFFNGTTVSNDDTLFLTIYTIPTGVNDYAPGFFHSANTYVFDQTITPIANTNYQGVCILDISSVPYNYETQIQYEPSTVNNPKGSYLPTDKILAVVIGTNSASVTGSVQLVVNKLNLHYADFTQSYLLIPP
jgi:hypothetical protein